MKTQNKAKPNSSQTEKEKQMKRPTTKFGFFPEESKRGETEEIRFVRWLLALEREIDFVELGSTKKGFEFLGLIESD